MEMVGSDTIMEPPQQGVAASAHVSDARESKCGRGMRCEE